jgi:hypothetical protein
MISPTGQLVVIQDDHVRLTDIVKFPLLWDRYFQLWKKTIAFALPLLRQMCGTDDEGRQGPWVTENRQCRHGFSEPQFVADQEPVVRKGKRRRRLLVIPRGERHAVAIRGVVVAVEDGVRQRERLIERLGLVL